MMKIIITILLLSIAAWCQCDSGVELLSKKKIIKIAVDNSWCSDTLQYKLDSVVVSFCVEDVAEECRVLGEFKSKRSKNDCLNILNSKRDNRLDHSIQMRSLLFGIEEFAFRIAQRGRVQVTKNGKFLDQLFLAEYQQYVRNCLSAPDGGTKGVGLFLPNGTLLFSQIKVWFD